MARYFLFIIGFLSVFSQSLAASESFNGLYGSVSLGYMNADFRKFFTSSIDVPMIENLVFQKRIPMSDNSAIGGIALGYGKVVKQKVFLGVEFRANIEDINPNIEDMLGNLSPNAPLQSVSQTSIKLKNDFSLLLKAGIPFEKKILLYGLIGPSFGNFKTSTSQTFMQNIPGVMAISGYLEATDATYDTGLLTGLGIEYLYSSHISVALEFNYVDYHSMHYPAQLSAPLTMVTALPLTGTITSVNSFHASTNNTSLRVTYYI